MSFKNRTLGLGCLLLALGWAGSAQAQFALTADSAGQLQIGTGLPLPVGPAGIFLGGMTPGDADNFPPMLINPNPTMMAIVQNQSTAKGGTMMIPANVLDNDVAAARPPIAVFTTNPAVFQVRTTINYAWPLAAATFAPGDAPGVPGTTVTVTGPGGNLTFPAQIKYSGSTKAFGGAARFAITAGPFAGTFRVPPNPALVVPIASVWINFKGAFPASAAMTILIAGASNPLGYAAPGAPLADLPATTMFGPVAKGLGVGAVVGSMGTVIASVPFAAAVPSNMVTATEGFPWTTGFITLTQPLAGPAEVFYLEGTDNRVAGNGNIQLVSGALSTRKLSGPNANRAWLDLNLVPEPIAALGATAALALLGLVHGLVRRRSN
jgi:hypothetical protein